MAYVGCIAGAIEIDAYREGMLAAGFSAVEIQDSGADLNAYAQVEGQGGCCSPSMAATEGDLSVLNDGLAIVESGCCSPAVTETSAVHADLADLLRRYNVNDFAASVKVFAVKG
jgi:arsenite methyltransferase